MKEFGGKTLVFSSMGSREGTLQLVSGWKPNTAIPLVFVCLGGVEWAYKVVPSESERDSHGIQPTHTQR